jgi:hypothetical protein
MDKIRREESRYVDLPKIYAFKSQRDKEIMLNRNFTRINNEIDSMIQMLLVGSGKQQ